MELAGVEVAVIGLGVSGVAAARLALSEGGEVYVSDSREEAAVAARGADLALAGAAVQLGGHDIDRVAGSALVVVSPGIPPDAAVLRALSERGVRWLSEPEFAARFFDGQLIAVTGTNGKTTVTLMVEHLLAGAGLHVAAGGNVGGGLAPAASDLVRVDDPFDWWVLEMSSFQLAGIERFRPDIGVVTNLAPDHLDRYPSVEAYYADKARLFETADESSRWVLPADDVAVAGLAGDAPGRRYYFGAPDAAHAYEVDGTLTLRVDDRPEPLCTVEDLPLLGRHNVRNALTAALTARLAGVSALAISEALRTVRALPHRLEPVAERAGVLWVNDSKATNVAAAVGAVESLDRPIVLLCGGKDKGEPFGPLAEAGRGRVRKALAYGAAGPRLARETRDALDVDVLGRDLAEVVRRAAEIARPGDVVLLSPACSSYDMFESYEDRGRRFAELARRHA